eukprot:TRINITY_DN27718_c0_g1_i1.p1 TRINITY_DN27718_c0_g1~~TRINITY_DN27718_c0_g1_i1.p1  ORF type:complete len:204 (+),score=0.37 TRINITY_DN27718_c0_g1_i1:121-732(+)
MLRLVFFCVFVCSVFSKEWVFRVHLRDHAGVLKARPEFAGLVTSPTHVSGAMPAYTTATDKWVCFEGELLNEHFEPIGTAEDCIHTALHLPYPTNAYTLHVNTGTVKGEGTLVVANYRDVSLDMGRMRSTGKFFFKEGTVLNSDSLLLTDLCTGVFQRSTGTCHGGAVGDATHWLSSTPFFGGSTWDGPLSGSVTWVCKLKHK